PGAADPAVDLATLGGAQRRLCRAGPRASATPGPPAAAEQPHRAAAAMGVGRQPAGPAVARLAADQRGGSVGAVVAGGVADIAWAERGAAAAGRQLRCPGPEPGGAGSTPQSGR